MIDETTLTKGQFRKLTALRKSLGPVIADDAFCKWLDQKPEEPETDDNAETIAAALWGMIQDGRIAIPRGGYLVRRGRRRVIVEAPGAPASSPMNKADPIRLVAKETGTSRMAAETAVDTLALRDIRSPGKRRNRRPGREKAEGQAERAMTDIDGARKTVTASLRITRLSP